jgi:hypothetical protein
VKQPLPFGTEPRPRHVSPGRYCCHGRRSRPADALPPIDEFGTLRTMHPSPERQWAWKLAICGRTAQEAQGKATGEADVQQSRRNRKSISLRISAARRLCVRQPLPFRNAGRRRPSSGYSGRRSARSHTARYALRVTKRTANTRCASNRAAAAARFSRSILLPRKKVPPRRRVTTNRRIRNPPDDAPIAGKAKASREAAGPQRCARKRQWAWKLAICGRTAQEAQRKATGEADVKQSRRNMKSISLRISAARRLCVKQPLPFGTPGGAGHFLTIAVGEEPVPMPRDTPCASRSEP